MKISTGYGYFVKSGKKISKYELPIGEHPNPINCDFVEVADKAMLEAVVLDKTNKQVSVEQERDIDIQIKSNREAFIDALMSGDVQAQTDLKDAQAFLMKKVKE